MADVVYKNGSVQITTAIAKFGETSYPIANIGAVTLQDDPSGFLGLGIIMALVGIGMAIFGSEPRAAGAILLGGIVAAAIGYNLSGSKLILRTSSGNEQAFRSPDKQLVREIKTAIERAISARR